MLRIITITMTIACLATSCHSQTNKEKNMEKNNKIYSHTDTSKVVLDDKEWKELLTPEQYYVARQKGTERPFTSKYEDFNGVGTYYCAACGNPLFRSNAKFDSGCGWPSFFEPISKNALIYQPDHTHGMDRTEVLCGRCKAHLGHVFDDGPKPTGLRYCMNGVVLDFKEEGKK
ncbi:MAG: peptide-methionine (R)-S-oxide reductase MsrB [Chitinophagaceae bacterium]